MFQPIAERLVAELAPQPGERALDVGCGRGAVLLRLARAVGPSGALAGIDLSPRMAAAAREAVAACGVADNDVRVGDAMQPEWPPSSFDVIASSLVLFFLPEPVEALKRWRELLVDGGRLGVSTFGQYSPSWKAVDAVFEPYLPPGMRDARTSGATGPFGSDQGVEQLFEDAGLTEIRTTSMNVDVRFRDAEHWYEWSWSVGARAMWEHVTGGPAAGGAGPGLRPARGLPRRNRPRGIRASRQVHCRPSLSAVERQAMLSRRSAAFVRPPAGPERPA